MSKKRISVAERRGWVEDRQRLLRQIQIQVANRLGLSATDSPYARQYYLEFGGRWVESDTQELLAAIRDANWVFGSDFHAFRQSQKVHLRVLRQIRRKNVVIALECFESRHQAVIESFMMDQISEEEFLRQVQWEKSWGFPYENYRPLIELARERRWRVVGINTIYDDQTDRALHARDEEASLILADLTSAKASPLVYTILGDFHLAQSHMPERMRELTGASNDKMVVLFQNEESLYFKFVKNGLARVPDVLKGSNNRFCILSSPPWVKWQSYLMFLENAYDRDLQDQGVDPTDHVLALVKVLSSDLGVKVKDSDLSVYGPESVAFDVRMQKSLRRGEKQAVQALVNADRSFLLPAVRSAYLSRFSVNHAATVAGQFIHSQLSQRHENYLRMPDDFLAQIWIEAVGFFLSKLVNPQRKSETIQSLRQQVRSSKEQRARKTALLQALDQRTSEIVAVHLGRRRQRRWRKGNLRSDLESSKILGHMLGERMFVRLESGGLTLSQFRELLMEPVTENTFTDFYYRMIGQFEL